MCTAAPHLEHMSPSPFARQEVQLRQTPSLALRLIFESDPAQVQPTTSSGWISSDRILSTLQQASQWMLQKDLAAYEKYSSVLTLLPPSPGPPWNFGAPGSGGAGSFSCTQRQSDCACGISGLELRDP